MTCDDPTTVGCLAEALADRFPLSDAEPWDRVGLIVGDAGAVIEGARVTLDATAEAVDRALSSGANVLITHHPPFLEAPERVVAGPGPEGALEAAVRGGCAIISMHTNLDRSSSGADALPLALGFEVIEPLEIASQAISLITVFAPPEIETSLRTAMHNAGAGRIGGYEGCAFVAEGSAHFTPGRGTAAVRMPAVGGVDEVRIEMVCAPEVAESVLEAARGAHPYEEPLIIAVDGVRARGRARLGRICTWRMDATVADLAQHVAAQLQTDVRVWGVPESPVSRIAVANGSAGTLLRTAAQRAEVILAGEVRYHDALSASAAGLAIIEAGHDVTEWPLVEVLYDTVRDLLPGTPVVRENPARGWWTTEAANDRR